MSLEALLPLSANAVAAVCVAIVGRADAEDAAQECFERIVRGYTSFDPSRGTFVVWASSIARNVCRDRMRRRGLEARLFDASEDATVLPSNAASPERIALGREVIDRLDDALAGLPERQRTALVLFHLEGLSYEDVANVLDVPIGTVMTWLHRGRAQIRVKMESP